MTNKIQPEKSIDLDQLIKKLKSADSNYARISRAIQFIHWIFIPLFTVLTVLEYNETNDVNQIIGGVCFVLAYLIFALFFGKYYKEYKYVDYSLPTAQMLRKAVWRYQPFQKRSVWILLALIFMDLGLVFNHSSDDAGEDIQLFFLIAIGVGVVAGLILWYIRYKPLHDGANKLLKEIESA